MSLYIAAETTEPVFML